ncbi:MAG: hypothetical protein GX087_07435 [Desulfobulbaceae bacterium]|nr:hypothetical protein [Desulfobulbaceae bacterium]
MKKMTAFALTLGFSTLLVLPGSAMGRPYASAGVGYSPVNNVHLGAYHSFYASDAAWGGFGTLSLGDIFVPFIVDPPLALDMPFSQPSYAPGYASQPVYSYPPEVPPGLCRWERNVLDANGWPLLDASGMAIKEYTIGSCFSPPQ